MQPLYYAQTEYGDLLFAGNDLKAIKAAVKQNNIDHVINNEDILSYDNQSWLKTTWNNNLLSAIQGEPNTNIYQVNPKRLNLHQPNRNHWSKQAVIDIEELDNNKAFTHDYQIDKHDQSVWSTQSITNNDIPIAARNLLTNAIQKVTLDELETFIPYLKNSQKAIILYKLFKDINDYWLDNDPLYSLEIQATLQRMFGYWFTHTKVNDQQPLTLNIDPKLVVYDELNNFESVFHYIKQQALQAGYQKKTKLSLTFDAADQIKVNLTKLFKHPDMLINTKNMLTY